MKKVFHFLFKKYPKISLSALGILLLLYTFGLPKPLFDAPFCMVLEDREGQLLGAKIATDGQWRFPQIDSIPYKFEQSILEFEDRRFYSHWGIDLRSLARAISQNVKNGRIVSGGSTISMQIMRMARGNQSRNIWHKLIEMILATRLEMGYTKEQILQLYASHAPFGGNVVGLEAASWRYFGKGPHLLSWAESAMLAVLPNSPSLIHPGRNRSALFEKRNRLLGRLHESGLIDQFTLELSLEEPLPGKPLPLPRYAPHLLERAHQELVLSGKYKNAKIKSTLSTSIQTKVDKTISRYQSLMRHNEVHNLAAIVIDVETNEVLAYVGNASDAGEAHGEAVDIITAARSTGSILKPLLYAMMIQEGTLHPNSLIPDVPTQLSGYRPENFHEEYDGIVSAKRALIRSLNVPMVHLLQQYGLEKFHYNLRKLGFSTIHRSASEYGLPLILGGAEANLWDLTNVYAAMARTLEHVDKWDGEYALNDFDQANYHLVDDKKEELILSKTPPLLSTDAIWMTFESMKKLERPSNAGTWQAFSSRRNIAWKTGTSFGYRDAWAIGVTPKYTVGVWVGNADGEGRPGIVGVQAAAPVLFDIFNELPYSSNWFKPPYDALQEMEVCKISGYRPSTYCPKDTVWASANNQQLGTCPFHQKVFLTPDSLWQASSKCISPQEMVTSTYFVLPPIEEYYYKSKNPDYQSLPPFRRDCRNDENAEVAMQLIYPKEPTRIYVPVDLDGTLSRTVFTIAHRLQNIEIHWHLDEYYIGSTTDFHNMELSPSAGRHKLALVDEKGGRLELDFEIIEK